MIACKICNNASGNRVHRTKEMMFGLGDTFAYVECAACGCVGLMDPPSDLSKFYPPTYCSFRGQESGLRGLAKQLRVHAYFGHRSLLGSWIVRRYPRPDLGAMARMSFPKNLRILDVGCGDGKLLRELKTLGYENLMGTDPFVESDIDLGNNVIVKRCRLTDLQGVAEWDVIMFHHSFEHIPDQFETMKAAARLLAAKGLCVIRIPVIGYAWQHYGTQWVQLDPPRHFFLHSEKSMELLSLQSGFRVQSVSYDSNEFQFWGSELYRREIPLRTAGVPHKFFSARQLSDYRRRSAELNMRLQGDQAVFVLSHT